MALATTDIWWAALEKSNLLSPEQLADARSDAAETGVDGDVKTLAERLVKRGLVTRWQADQLLAGKTNLFLGRYKLEKRIGKGGMGAVYKAHHTVMGRAVALKVMAPSLLSDATAVARFRREVEAAAKLNHPNIVSAYDADCVGKTHFLVMEYIDGSDLKHWFDRHAPLPIPWVCECIRQAAVGLQHAHEHGMVHRDLKPSNLLVTSDKPNGPPIIKILDMGLARFISTAKEDEGLTQSGQIMGTPDYIAPEQAEDTKRADIRSDIFSLGCTLFYLLTGELPFRGESIMAKLMARIQSVAPPIRSLRGDVPPELEAAIAKMLASDPAARQQTPAEVAAALAHFAANVSAGTAETISLSAPAEIPTLTSAASPPEVDTGLSDFLANLANRPSSATRPGGRTLRTRVAGIEQTGEKVGSGSIARLRIPKLTIVMAAAAAGLVLLIASVAFVLKSRDRGPTAKNEPTKSTSGASVIPEMITAERAKAPPVPTPGRPMLDAAASEKAVREATAQSKSATPDGLSFAKPAELENQPTAPGKPALPEPKPAANAASSDVSASKPASPTTPAPPRTPQTHIVGVADGQLPDLKTAFEKAGPDDTILIRHRGPLEFAPVDLSGKTPLTIIGDSDRGSASGTDYWPILRQAPLNPADKAEPRTADLPGLFSGNQLHVTFRKLHLVAAGPKRAGIGAVFGCAGGRVELDHCTVTVGVQGNPGELPGTPLPLVRTTPEAKGPLELVLNNSFLRGLRLQSCVSAEGAQQIDIKASQTIWAGGSAPWMVARDTQGPVKLALHNCTIYNVPSFLSWESHDETASKKSNVDAQAEKCLFVGPYANKEPFVAWNPGDPKADLVRAAADGTVRWRGSNNVYHRYNSFFSGADPRKQPALEEWRKLWSQSGPSMARQADPIFRVWPDGYELQETLARDFQPRFSRSKTRGQGIEADVGADHHQIPDALVNIVDRPLPSPEIAAKPRGVPRVLRVHQKEGPYKTLESAFTDVQDEDIVEIADDASYSPRRNFDAAPADAILVAPAGHVTLRAADGISPTVVLRDDLQKGQIPKPHGSESRFVALVTTSTKSTALTIEGIHFRTMVGNPVRRTILVCPQGATVRVTSCSFLDVGRPFGKASGGHFGPDPANSAVFLVTDNAQLVWFENDVFFPLDKDVCWNVFSYTANPRMALVRNCICEGTLATLGDRDSLVTFQIEACSLVGRLSSSGYPKAIRTRENLIYSSASVFPTEIAGARAEIRVEGQNNWLWLGGQALTEAERNAGIAGMLPGPLVTVVPAPEGPSTPKDPYRRYRLKKGQPASRMSADGGPVGVRFEYLPDLPALPPEFFGTR